MPKDWKQHSIGMILCVYFSCFVFRGAEYLLLRTDRTFWGEAFLHKLAGILILWAALKCLSINWGEVGFSPKGAGRNVCRGLLLGGAVFAIAYGAELLILRLSGNPGSLRLYITSYGITGNHGSQTALIFYVICIAGNLINVVMEEGVFRGLFLKLAETRYAFLKALLLSSALFGVWHIAAPARGLLDGEMSPAGAAMSALMLVLTTALAGVKFCLLTKLTGSLWMPMADHFVNNTVVNMLHVVTGAGADQLQVARISVAQTVSFITVLLLYWKTGAHKKQTFRV